MQFKIYTKVALLATMLAFVVIVLGAYTRITDAGLSCPDWPGCYGQLTVPAGEAALQEASRSYPEKPVESEKAWTEMVHRYCAAVVGLLILWLAFQAKKHIAHLGVAPWMLCRMMLGLLIFQVLLGMWTVTLKLLPLIVLMHLIMGMTLLGLLWSLTLIALLKTTVFPNVGGYKPWVFLGLGLIVMQLLSGGWTSTQMAGHVCQGFPVCSDIEWDRIEWARAFHMMTPLGHMPFLGLVAITNMHRLGALIIFLYWGLLSILGLMRASHPALKGLFGVVLLILLMQMGLGFMNIDAARPLWIATLHNFGAALLLLLALTLSLIVSREAEIS